MQFSWEHRFLSVRLFTMSTSPQILFHRDLIWAHFAIIWCVCFAPIRAAEYSHWEKVLEDRGIEIGTEGIVQYLRGLHPDPKDREKAMQLVEQLGSGSFADRDRAMQTLLNLPAVPAEVRQAAANAADPEIRWRANLICEKQADGYSRTLYAVFNVVAHRRLTGTVPDLLAAIPLCDVTYLREAATKALKATAQPSDRESLEKALESENKHLRVAAVLAISWSESDYADKLKPLLDDADDDVRLVAARACANLCDRDSLAVLVNLLSSEQSQVRTSSSVTLRDLTGEQFDYRAFDKLEARKKAIDKWVAWTAGHAASAKLKIPLKPLGSRVGVLNGNTLLAYGHNNKVKEIDPAGREVWSYETQHAWSAEKLANGNVLIAAYMEGKVLEVDPSGDTVWEYPCKTCLNARPLPNGNILAIAHTEKKVYEVTRDKRVVWEFTTEGLSCDAHRLENGNTLLSEDNLVREVDRDGKTVWKFEAKHPYGIEPLPNGNVLICDLGSNHVIEVTRDKEIVWKFDANRPVDAYRLPNGNTLITDANRFVEVTPEKKVVWSKDGCKYGTARR